MRPFFVSRRREKKTVRNSRQCEVENSKNSDDDTTL
jgi:hypothetical protein